MTDDRMALKAALEKASDTELLSHMLGFVAEKLMALDVDQLCNASRHERTGARANYRNGYRERNWETRAGIVAVAVNTDGRREVLGIDVMPSEAEGFWSEFLRSLADRGLRGVKLIIADEHKGLKAAADKVLGATIQRCRVHFMRNALACAGKKDKAIARERLS